MNWLTIGTLAVLVLYMINGARRGMIRTAFSLAGILLTLILGYLFSPAVSEFLKEETPVYQSIQKSCEESIQESIGKELENQTDRKQQNAFIESLPLPKELQEILIRNNNTEGYNRMVAETFAQYLSNSAAQIAVGVISLILTFFLIRIVLRFLEGFLDGVFSLPILSSLNRLGGAALGAIQGLFLIWIVFLILMLFWDTGWSQTALEFVQKSELTAYLYEKNVLVNLITGFFKG